MVDGCWQCLLFDHCDGNNEGQYKALLSPFSIVRFIVSMRGSMFVDDRDGSNVHLEIFDRGAISPSGQDLTKNSKEEIAKLL